MTNKLDPRFRRAPKKATKVVVDERFQGMFTEGDFVAPVQVDKYGRKVRSDREKRDLARFYRLEDDDKAADASEREEEEEEEEEKEKDYETASRLHATTSESESESSTLEEGEAVMDEILSSHPLVLRDVPTGEATRRLALVNLDWDQIRADDIYTVLHGFKPITGIIHSVTVYPSRFGKERMQREAVEGPARELFVQKTSPTGDGDGTSERELDEEELDAEVEEELRIKDQDDQEDRESTALRKYQLERLRYYYAVVECDSAATASHIYRHCDGSEFEKSTNFLDLRFIPDHVTFTAEEDGPIRDVATELPQKYHPKPDLATAALQRSRVALTWDADDTERVRAMRRPQRGVDPEEEDLRAYLASATEDETEAEEEATVGGKSDGLLALKYRELLLGDGTGPDEAGAVYGRKSSGRGEQLKITFASALKSSAQATGNDDDEDDIHMEAQFHLSEGEGSTDDDHGKRAADKAKDDRTPFQRYLERRKAKREARKSAVKEAKETVVAESKSQRKKRRVVEREQRAVESERLSLLLDRKAGEDDDDEDGAMRRGRHRPAGSGEKRKRSSSSRKEAGGDIDLADPRFAAVFEESSYALDPSHPSFRRTKATDQLIKERQKRLHQRS